MLATMRTTQVLPSNSSIVSNQHTSHSSQQTPSTSSISQQPNKVRNTMANKATTRGGKHDSPAAASAPAQSTPGLLTLSKPIQSYDAESTTTTNGEKSAKKKKKKPVAAAMQHQISEERPASVRSQRNAKKSAALDNVKADEHILSHSAPTSSTDDGWEMPLRSTNDQSTFASSGALTWQQQLLASQPSSNKAGAGEKKKARKKDKVGNGKSAQEGAGLTWQQELLSSNKPRGQTYDVFADARDAATFGSAAGHTAASNSVRNERHSRQRADSLGDIDSSRFKGKKSVGGVQLGTGSGQSSSSGPPSTPNKLAYAGPNFHNSPSPASLPVPKFLQAKGGVVSGLSPSVSMSGTTTHGSSLSREAISAGLSTSSASESEEDENRSFSHLPADPSRFARGGTAPPTLSAGQHGDNSRSVTIENLLANMMRPSAS